MLDLADVRWASLLSEAPTHAASAIEAVAYTSVAVSYGRNGVMLKLRRAAAEAPSRVFGTGDEFVKAIAELGLEPCFINVLGTVEAVGQHVNERLAAWRRSGQRTVLEDPPYRMFNRS